MRLDPVYKVMITEGDDILGIVLMGILRHYIRQLSVCNTIFSRDSVPIACSEKKMFTVITTRRSPINGMTMKSSRHLK